MTGADRRVLRLRRDFERSLAVVAPALAERYGPRLTERLADDARTALERLAARVPWVHGPRGVVFNGFLAITAQELAAFHAFRDHGYPPEEAWSWCHRALSERLARLPAWRRRLLARIMGSSTTRRIVARRARGGGTHRFGGFEVRYHAGDGVAFDFGVDYLRCANLDFVRVNDGAAFAPFVCLSDLALSEALGWGLVRSETLADGCARCDFRFRAGGPTRISSRSPRVQAAIEASRGGMV
jgi:hypothetical protein